MSNNSAYLPTEDIDLVPVAFFLGNRTATRKMYR